MVFKHYKVANTRNKIKLVYIVYPKTQINLLDHITLNSKGENALRSISFLYVHKTSLQ